MPSVRAYELMLLQREALLQRTRLLGPAFVAAVAYVDPGNVATNTQAGAGFGYLLLWVLVGATLMAGLVQYLSAKVGWLTGETLPGLVARRNSRLPRICYWIQAELVATATDLAEIVGGAVALNLLFDLPLVTGALITTAISTGLLFLQNSRSQRTFERVITGMLAIVTIGFLAGLIASPPDAAQAVAGLVPKLSGAESAVLAVGMLGAYFFYLQREAGTCDLPAFGIDPRPARSGRSGLCGSHAAYHPARCRARDAGSGHSERRHAAAGCQHTVRHACGWPAGCLCCDRS